jgi:Phage integrase family
MRRGWLSALCKTTRHGARALPKILDWTFGLISINGRTIRACEFGDLLENGYNIRTVHELLGHTEVSTTMIYTQALNRGGKGVRSRPTVCDRFAARRVYWIYERRKRIDKLSIEEVNFALSFLEPQYQ